MSNENLDKCGPQTRDFIANDLVQIAMHQIQKKVFQSCLCHVLYEIVDRFGTSFHDKSS